MARLARVIAVGVPHHITQRANARRFILQEEAERRVYLDLPRGASVYARCSRPHRVISLYRKRNREGFKHAPTTEHLVARSIGGTDARRNCRLAQKLCNMRAGSMSVEEKLRPKKQLHAEAQPDF